MVTTSTPSMSETVARLVPALRARAQAIVAASGGRLRITSGWRSADQQIRLRREHCGPTHYDIWEKPAGECNPPTARPGTSKHERGEAVDISGDYALLATLGPAHGLVATVRGEPWHWELAEGTPTGAAQALPGVGAIAGLGGDLADSLVDPFIDGLRRLTVTGSVLAAGAALLVLGGVRLTTGKDR